MGKQSLFSALILLQSSYIFCSNSTTDEQALLAFRSTITSDPSHTLSTNWSTTTACAWYGVSCDAKHRITSLNLSGLSLGGTIAPHLGNISFLTSLDLSLNRFTGTLPDTLSGLTRLREINLEFNNFTGEVPPWLGTKLNFISLQNNSFRGEIPNLSNLSNVQFFDMSYNFIHGRIPEEIRNLSAMISFDLKYNELTGSLPSSIFNLSALEMLDLTSNSLSGRMAARMCDNLTRLEGLFLSDNQFSGPIPSSLYKCRGLQRLSLSFNQFDGSIPREIGKLAMLKNLYMGANSFEGGIPPEIGNLSRLEILSIRKSSLTGEIPSFIFNMSSLKEMDLSYNGLSGSLPSDIHHNLPNLEQAFLQSNRLTGESLSSFLRCDKLWLLQLSKNQFTGVVPKEIGNMTQLKILYIHENITRGEIPSEIGGLNMEYLVLASNGFSGSIPTSIFNISTMVLLELSSNHFNGRLPATTGVSLANLESLVLQNNSITGSIPSYIANASKLSIIDLGTNSFTGLIPDFGSLRLLQRLLFGRNNLTGVEYPNQELRFLSSLQNCRDLELLEMSSNQLNGVLPVSVGNLSASLKIFRAFGCRIKGSIPGEIVNLTALDSIDLDGNELTGLIPTQIGKLKNLEVIYLENNRFEGGIPSSLCQLSRLWDLYLSNNMLNGTIPQCLGQMKSLQRVFLDSNRLTSVVPNLWNLTALWGLNLSKNLLTGQISSEVKNLKALRDLDLSWNQFSGDIPSSIGDIESLETLSFAHNNLQGSIPQSLGNLKGLESLDLSNNNLTGSIPGSLVALRDLRFFDVSHNSLEGEIPTGGSFSNFSPQSFVQNYKLCGLPQFRVPPCIVQTERRSRSKHVSLIIYVMVSIVVAILAVAITLWLIRRRKTSKQTSEVSTLVAWRRVSYQELVQATEGFNEVNSLGSGSFGSVYKATLSDGLSVAVKVFNLELENATKSFDVECEVMSSIRHKNLVKIISCCSNLEFKALVLEYMPNGSLEKWLYSHNYCLDLQQRLNIAIDVASALEYLHHGNELPIVHCDLKPSNVLLDEDMTAHVGDFGVSKLFGEAEVVRQTTTLATIGYMAPEYGSEGKVSTNGDVYSYGIMLLEMFTRKKPTDDMFSEEMSLKEWVSEALLENAEAEVVSPALLAREDQHFSAKEQCVSSIFRLAMRGLTVAPEERIDMVEMVVALKKIRASFLASTARRRHVGTTSRRDQEVIYDG